MGKDSRDILDKLYDSLGKSAPLSGEEITAIVGLVRSVLPFVRLIEMSSGRIPTEKLSLANWHDLVKSYRALNLIPWTDE